MENSINPPSNSKQPTISAEPPTFDKGKWEAEWKEKVREEERQRKRLAAERALGGPECYEQFTFEKFNPDLNGTHKILQVCQDFNPLKANLFIVGPQGTGKTHLATAIARRVIDTGGRGKVFRGKELAAFLRGRKSYATDHDEVDAIEQLAGYTVLVFDDIEDFPVRDSQLAALKVLFDRRKNQQRFGCIITSNRSIAELATIIGPKNADRIEGEFKHLVIPSSIPSARGILKKIKK